ncbi:MAG TPA: lipid-binding SYLF domain-containing protein [Candidatus Acidoferrum sp.]|nr:lipid-binding SYLF domain-containing protein [Candidatus Acidoferrum sp.]
MMKIMTGALLIAACALPVLAQKDAEARLTAATEDLKEMMNASDKGIPQELLSKASCVVVIPNQKAAGFIVGGQYGKGFFSCRKPSGVGWSAPGSLRISGGKFGFLIGGQETDVIMLVMNDNGMQHLLSSKFKLGGEAAAAAGPVGRSSTAMTDAQMRAQILTYSRSRGAYVGLELAGDAVTEDDEANMELYGKKISNKEILKSSPQVPHIAQGFVRTLDRISSRK